MKKILEKISWETRNWNIKFSLFDIYLNDERNQWGIRIISILKGFSKYSFLSIIFRLPNKTSINRFVIDEWDFLYLYNYLYEKYEKLDDIRIYGKHNKRQVIIYKILEKIV